jgi:serine/threonine protein kinase
MASIQYDQEYQILGQINFCPAELNLALHLNLEKLNLVQLGQLVETRYYDYYLFQALSCLLQSINWGVTDPFQSSILTNHWIELTRALSSQGANSVVYEGGLRQLTDLFIVKMGSPVDLIHEYFVGSVATNHLRQQDSGYAYVFPLLTCPRDGGSLKCSETGNNVSHLLYERIKGPALSAYLAQVPDQKSLFLITMQILNTLKYGSSFEFLHGDLHVDNIILRVLPGSVERMMTLGSYIIRFESNVIPTLIDFGLSRINFQGQIFRNRTNANLEKQVDLDIYNPMVDVYKLLASILNVFRNLGRVDLLPLVVELFIPLEVSINDLFAFDELNTSSYFYPLGPIPILTIDQYVNRLPKSLLQGYVMINSDNCQSRQCSIDIYEGLGLLGMNSQVLEAPRDLVEVAEYVRNGIPLPSTEIPYYISLVNEMLLIIQRNDPTQQLEIREGIRLLQIIGQALPEVSEALRKLV